MNVNMQGRSSGRPSAQPRPTWPEAPLTVDPDKMHPRAVAMAEAMRAGAMTFRDLGAEGFTTAEIAEFRNEAVALAKALSTRQVTPGADRLSEMIAKALAAIANQLPHPKGAAETQAAVVAWNRYCASVSAYRLDPWPSQRERCIDLLRLYFRQTPAGDVVSHYVVSETAAKMRVMH
jgi:hypothetical protein